MWDDSIQVQIKSMNSNIICAYISDSNNKFWISCVYEHPEIQYRKKVRDKLVNFASSINSNEEWIVIGDFNQVLSDNDKMSYKKSVL